MTVASFDDLFRNRPTLPPAQRPSDWGDAGDLSAYVSKVCDGVANAINGTRNDTLNRAAYTLGRIIAAGQLNESEVVQYLADAGRTAGLEDAEIGPTIASGLAAGKEEPRGLEPAASTPEVTTIQVEEGEAHGDAVRRLFPLLDWRALWEQDDDEEWIVEPILPARRLVALYSAPKIGKSLLMLEIAVAVATGREVLGVTPDRSRRVLYVDFENDPRGDVRERLEAMRYSPDDLGDLCYLSFPTLAALDSERGSVELMAVLEEYACEVVVIDTVSRAVKGEENENDTWLDFYRHTGLKLKQAGISLIRLDHAGKDETKGQRGGSAKVGDVDAVWRLSKVTDDVFRLDCEANRMPVTEKEMVLHRECEPLRHRVEADPRRAALDARTQQTVEWLDQLQADPKLSKRDAAVLLREAGHQASNAAILRAQQQRRLSFMSVPSPAGTTPSESGPRTLGDHSGPRSLSE